MPVARGYARAATAADGRIWVVGGRDQTSYLSSTSVYDPASNTWAAGPSLPGNRSAAGMTLGPDGRLYVAGGEAAVGAMSAGVYQLNAAGSAFVARAALPSPRAYHGFVTLRDGRIACLGGAVTASRLAAVDTYDPADDAWR
ncbi:MAG: kelch-like protein [Myxococcaceae bacterium]|nr:MAG: kelch-like protein [Myxococcaceae bacterium]